MTNDYTIHDERVDAGKQKIEAKSRGSNDRTTALTVLKMYTDNATSDIDRAHPSVSKTGIPRPKVLKNSFTPTLASNQN